MRMLTGLRKRRTLQQAFAVMVSVAFAACAPVYFYKPALVQGTVVSTVSGEPISGARLSFETRAGDPISDSPVSFTDDSGRFRAGDRQARTLVGLEMMEAIESKSPVTLRIEADGYAPVLVDVEGRRRFRSAIELEPQDADLPGHARP